MVIRVIQTNKHTTRCLIPTEWSLRSRSSGTTRMTTHSMTNARFAFKSIGTIGSYVRCRADTFSTTCALWRGSSGMAIAPVVGSSSNHQVKTAWVLWNDHFNFISIRMVPLIWTSLRCILFFLDFLKAYFLERALRIGQYNGRKPCIGILRKQGIWEKRHFWWETETWTGSCFPISF